jgi:hypothetical protein
VNDGYDRSRFTLCQLEVNRPKAARRTSALRISTIQQRARITTEDSLAPDFELPERYRSGGSAHPGRLSWGLVSDPDFCTVGQRPQVLTAASIRIENPAPG